MCLFTSFTSCFWVWFSETILVECKFVAFIWYVVTISPIQHRFSTCINAAFISIFVCSAFIVNINVWISSGLHPVVCTFNKRTERERLVYIKFQFKGLVLVGVIGFWIYVFFCGGMSAERAKSNGYSFHLILHLIWA